jgi:hypothetical protein
MKAYGSNCIDPHLLGGEWSTSRPGRFAPGKSVPVGWVDLIAGMDDLKKRKLLTLPGLELVHISFETKWDNAK